MLLNLYLYHQHQLELLLDQDSPLVYFLLFLSILFEQMLLLISYLVETILIV